MKKTLKLTSLTLALLIAILALFSCSSGNVASLGTATVVVEKDGEFSAYEVNLLTVSDHNGGALALLEALEKDGFSYRATSGEYGAYVTEIDGLSPAPTCEYISIYTSVESDFAVPTEYMPTVSTVDYNGTALTYSGVGISQMNIPSGAIILFRVEGF